MSSLNSDDWFSGRTSSSGRESKFSRTLLIQQTLTSSLKKSPGTFEERPKTGKHRHISKRRTEHFDFSECRKLKLTPRRKHAATNLTLGEPQEACMFPATIMEDLEMAEEKEIMLWNKITYRGNKLHFLVQKSWVWPVNPPRPRPRPLQAHLASVSGRQHNLKHTTQSTSHLLLSVPALGVVRTPLWEERPQLRLVHNAGSPSSGTRSLC